MLKSVLLLTCTLSSPPHPTPPHPCRYNWAQILDFVGTSETNTCRYKWVKSVGASEPLPYERSCFRKPRTSDIRGTAMLNLRCVVPREASMFLCSCLFWHCQARWHLSTSDPESWLAVHCYRSIIIYMYYKYIYAHIYNTCNTKGIYYCKGYNSMKS